MKIIYGTGAIGQNILEKAEIRGGELLFTDSNPKLYGSKCKDIVVIDPHTIPNLEFDKIIVGSILGKNAIVRKLLDIGIPIDKIDTSYVDEDYFRLVTAKYQFLENYSNLIYSKGIIGSVAEGGVFEGEFAEQISKAFPDRKFYLFDTFNGFDKRDIDFESEHRFSNRIAGGQWNPDVTIECIMARLPHPDLAVIRNGWFPETAKGIEDKFVFVNLDFDLYQPILAGLEFFFPRMVYGGVILIHDYFSDTFQTDASKDSKFMGVKAAVDDFCTKNRIPCIPIGDMLSIAVIKN